MSNLWSSVDTAGVFGPGYEFDGGEGQRLEEGQYAVAAGEYGDKSVIYGDRAAMLDLGRRMVAAFADQPPADAVAFDAEKFRAWLDTSTGNGTIRDTEPLSIAYQHLDGDSGWLVETVLHMLHNTAWHGKSGWTYGDGVTQVKVWATAAAEGGPDGGLTGEVIVDGMPLSLGRMTERELIPAEHDTLPGYEAAEYALTAIAEQVNNVAARARALRPAGVIGFSRDDVECALLTLVEYRNSAPTLPDLSKKQVDVVKRVEEWAQDEDVIDGEVVEPSADEVAYQAAAEAAGHDYNNRAHPMHW